MELLMKEWKLAAAASMCAIASWNSAPAQDFVWQQEGQSKKSLLGWSVARSIDIDGDGFSEVLVNALLKRAGQKDPDEPHVYAFSGRTGVQLLDVTGPTGGYGGFGAPIAGAGDLDGDGHGDVAVGATGCGTGAQFGAGAVYVYSGASGSLLLALYGEEMGNHFGSQIAGLGDVNQDGVPDLLISAPNYTYYDPDYDSGKIYVYSGKDGALLFSAIGTKYCTLGYTLDCAGDVDADGVLDFIVGTTGFGPNGIVYSGNTFQPLYQYTDSGNGLAYVVAGVGDVNLDGHAEFAITASASPSHVYLYSGSDGSLLLDLPEQSSGESFGSAISGGVDVNADSIPDFLIGAPSNGNGGTWAGRVYLFSGKTGSLLYKYTGTFAYETLGIALQLMPDVTRDGIGDFTIGDFAYDSYRGRATVYAGNDLFLQANLIDVSAGDTLKLNTRGGDRGALALLALMDINSAPTFMILALGTLDSVGDWTVSGTVPPGLSGFSLTFESFAQKDHAKGGVVASSPVTVAVQ